MNWEFVACLAAERGPPKKLPVKACLALPDCLCSCQYTVNGPLRLLFLLASVGWAFFLLERGRLPLDNLYLILSWAPRGLGRALLPDCTIEVRPLFTSTLSTAFSSGTCLHYICGWARAVWICI